MYQLGIRQGTYHRSLLSRSFHSSGVFVIHGMFKQNWLASWHPAPLPLPSQLTASPFTHWLLFHLTLQGSKSCQVHTYLCCDHSSLLREHLALCLWPSLYYQTYLPLHLMFQLHPTEPTIHSLPCLLSSRTFILLPQPSFLHLVW